MEVLLAGTGGTAGWPQEGCRCASCMGARSSGRRREPGLVRVDDVLTFPGTTQSAATGYVVRRLPGGWDVTGPDGVRLLLATTPGAHPRPTEGTRPYDIALLDLLADPAQLGRLRALGLVHAETAVAARYTDHRIRSEQEMARRCEACRAAQGQDGQLISVPRPASTAAFHPAGNQRPRPHRTLITGGARSGKSAEAQLRLSGEPDVTYLAAGPWPAEPADGGSEPDAEWLSRVAAHRAARPSWWRTLETLDVASVLREETGAVLVDGIGTWLAGVMAAAGLWQPGPDDPLPAAASQAVAERIAELMAAWRQTSALVVAVTDQVGSGVVPAFWSGRLFRDQLGWLNQRLAAESELNLVVVEGQVIRLPG